MITYVKGGVTRQIPLSAPLSQASLSARSYKHLIGANIQTIFDLLRCDKKQLFRIRGLGTKSVNEIMDFLYHLRSYPDGSPVYPLAQDKTIAFAPDSVVFSDGGASGVLAVVPGNIKDLPLSDLPLSVRAFNRLSYAGYKTTRDLIGLTENDLLKIRNLGERTADEIMALLLMLAEDEIEISTSPIDAAVIACQEFSQGVSSHSLVKNNLFNALFPEFQAAQNEDRPVNFEYLYKTVKELRLIVAIVIRNILENCPFGIEKTIFFRKYRCISI